MGLIPGLAKGNVAMQVRVLGEIGAGEGRPHLLGGPTQRRVFAALVARRGEVVSVAELVEICWPDDDAPDRAEHNVRSYVHRLRSALGDNGDRIETASAGYRLDLDRSELDLDRFADLAAAATRLIDTGDIAEALERIDEADALWRGRPYGEFADEPWAMAEVARLTELHWKASEQRAEALLVAGRAGDAVVQLEPMIREAPLRERPRALLMRALYESGRQAEALRAFQSFRSMLLDEVGVEPSPDLIELDRAIASGGLEASTNRSRVVRGYRILERLGEGAFSIVYRGTQPSVDRDVAIKQIRAELANRPDFIRRFEAEAHMVANLEHPYIVPLYDYWREPGSAYLVMRLLPGGSLESSLLGGPWDLTRTSKLVEQIGAALSAAHRAGVVHRDVKPANILLDDDGNAYLTDFGIALAGSELTEPEASLSAGSPAYAAPEQLRRERVGPAADVHGLAIAVYEALVGRLPFPDEPNEASLLQRQLNDPIPAVRAARTDIPLAVDDVLQRATAKDPADRYHTIEEFVAAFEFALSTTPTTPARGTRTIVTAAERNPFKGLRAFDETDSRDFTGRDRLVDQLVAELGRNRILAVVGPSGSGKSSVVRAGLLPALRRDAVPGSSDWFVSTLMPGAHPDEEMEAALLRVASERPPGLLDILRSDDRGISRALRQVLPENGHLLLVIDQFEEVFTLCADESERRRFLDGLAAAVSEERSRLHVVVTLRADFYDRPLRYESIGRLVRDATVAVLPLAADELERAIVDPAHSVGAEYEPGLVSEIIADVNDQPGALPMLQYALTELWERRVSGLLTRDAYRQLGGVSGALARRAEELYTQSSPEEQRATRHLFGRLVTFGDGTEDVRRRTTRSELGNDPATTAVIETFGAARLFSFDRDPATREPTIEVAHEALIREWPRLREWLDDDRDELRTHRHLTLAATGWVERDRDPNELYRGARLESAEPLLDTAAVTLNDTELEFLQASVQHRDEQLEAERQRVRRLHRLVAITAVVAALALVAGAVALVQRGRADDQAAKAETEAATAQAARADADAAAALAETEAAAATAARADADAAAASAQTEAQAAMAARADADVDRLRSQAVAIAAEQPEVAALLAVEAHRLDPSTDTGDALQRVLTALPSYRGHIPAFAFPSILGADETTLAAFGPEGAEIWDLATMTRLHTVSVQPSATGGAAFSPDGSMIISSNAVDGTSVIDVASGDVIASMPAWSGSVEFSPDSTRIALGTDAIEIFDARTLAPVDRLDGPSDDVSVVWSHDEDVLVVEGGGTLEAWNVPDRSLLWSVPIDPAGGFTLASDIMLSPDQQRVLVSSIEAPDPATGSQFRLHAFDLTTGAQPFEPTVVSNILWSITALDDRGDVVAGTGPGVFNNTLAYDLVTGTEVESPSPGLGTIIVGYSSALDLFLTSGNSGVYLWSRDGSSALETRLELPRDWVSDPEAVDTAINPDGETVTVSNWTTFEHVTFDLRDERPVPSAPEPGIVRGYGEYTLAIDADGARLVDAEGAPLGPPVPVPADLGDVAASHDGRLFAIGHDAGVVELYRSDGSQVATLRIPDALASLAMFVTMSDDGSLVAAFLQGLNQAFAVWDTETLEVVQRGAGFDHIRYLLGGDVLYAQVGELTTIDRLDPFTLEPIGAPLVGHTFAFVDVAVDAATGVIATNSVDPAVRLWDLETGTQIGRALPSRAGSGTQFSADGTRLVTPNGDSVSVWNLDRSTWPEIACEIAGRNLTPEEWAEYGPQTIEYRATCPQYLIES